MGWKEDDKGRTGRNRNDKSIKELTVPSFLLSPHYRIYRHLLLQAVLLLPSMFLGMSLCRVFPSGVVWEDALCILHQ